VLLVGGLPHLVVELKESSSNGTVDGVVQQVLPVGSEPVEVVDESVGGVLSNLTNEDGLVVLARQSLHSIEGEVGVGRTRPQVGVSRSSVTSISGEDVDSEISGEVVV